MILYCEDCGDPHEAKIEETFYICKYCKQAEWERMNKRLEESTNWRMTKKPNLYVHECEACGDPYSSEVERPTYVLCDNCMNPNKSVLKPKKAESFEEIAEDIYKKMLPDHKTTTGKSAVYEFCWKYLGRIVNAQTRLQVMKVGTVKVLHDLCKEINVNFLAAVVFFSTKEVKIQSYLQGFQLLENEQYKHMNGIMNAAEDSSYVFAMMHEGHKFKESIMSLYESGTVDDIDDEDEEAFGPRLAQIG